MRYVALLLSVCPRGFRSHHVTMRRACSCLTGPLVQKHRSAKELSACVCVCVREMMDCVSNDRPRYVPSAQCSIYTSSCCVCVVQVTTKAYFVCVCVCVCTPLLPTKPGQAIPATINAHFSVQAVVPHEFSPPYTHFCSHQPNGRLRDSLPHTLASAEHHLPSGNQYEL